MKGALKRLVWVDLQAIVLEAGEHFVEVLFVLLGRRGGNEDVVDVYHDKVQSS